MPLQLSRGLVKPSALMFSLSLCCALSSLVWTRPASAQGARQGADAAPRADESSIEQVSYDLYKSAQSGHVRQIGPTIAPNAPGWEHMTRGLSQWRSPTLSSSGRWVSQIEGRGGHLDFPITEEDEGLEELSIWLEPASPRQVVSLFLDEELINNISLKRRPKLYRLKLPKPLEVGEHRLRLWFRSSRVAPWGGRTAGAVGPIQFTPKGTAPSAPAQWTGEVLVDQQRWGVLYAPPVTSWRFYLVPPALASLQVSAWVGEGPASRFEVKVARDGEGEELLKSIELEPGEHQPLNLSLKSFAQTPIRLTLSATPLKKLQDPSPQLSARSSAQRKAERHMQVGWLSPKITASHPDPRALESAQLVLLWVIDGLNQDTLPLIERYAAELPTLSRFSRQAFKLPSLWVGGHDALAAHRVLLNAGGPKTLTELLSAAQVSSSLITLDEPVEAELIRGFDHIYEVTQEGAPGHVEGLGHLEEHLAIELKEASRAQRHFIYLSSSELKMNRQMKHGFKLHDERGLSLTQRRAFRQLALIDYQLMMVLSELSALGVLEQSVIALTGAPTPRAHIAQRAERSPADRAISSLEVSALLWHPRHLNSRVAIRGGHLGALSATLIQSLTHGEPSALPYDSLSAHLLSAQQLPPRAQRGQHNGAIVTRLGSYVLYEALNQPPSLRHIDERRDLERSQSHPITLRALKDSLSSARLGDGL